MGKGQYGIWHDKMSFKILPVAVTQESQWIMRKIIMGDRPSYTPKIKIEVRREKMKNIGH